MQTTQGTGGKHNTLCEVVFTDKQEIIPEFSNLLIFLNKDIFSYAIRDAKNNSLLLCKQLSITNLDLKEILRLEFQNKIFSKTFLLIPGILKEIIPDGFKDLSAANTKANMIFNPRLGYTFVNESDFDLKMFTDFFNEVNVLDVSELFYLSAVNYHEPIFFVCATEGSSSVLLVKNGEILFYNYYPYNSLQEKLYFVLQVASDYNISLSESGRVFVFDTIHYHEVDMNFYRSFVKNIKFWSEDFQQYSQNMQLSCFQTDFLLLSFNENNFRKI